MPKGSGGGLAKLIARALELLDELLDERRTRLRRIVHRAKALDRPRREIVRAVAEEMYRHAAGAGAHKSGDVVLGPWIYERDAEEFVDGQLEPERQDVE